LPKKIGGYISSHLLMLWLEDTLSIWHDIL